MGNQYLLKCFKYFYMNRYDLRYTVKKMVWKVDRDIFAYKIWAKRELEIVLMNMPLCNYGQNEVAAIIEELELYLTTLNDYQEIFQFTHNLRDVNPYEILIDLTSSFLDYLYDNKNSLDFSAEMR